MAKVLLVDDEPDIELLARQKFRKQIADGDFQLLFALNGQEALNLVQQDPEIKVVVSDVNMPEMDGLTLIDKLKEFNPSIRTIVVSAYGDTKTLRAAMNKGVCDFVTKPVDFKELGESILQTLAAYEAKTPPLYTYQLLLASHFPARIDLNVTHGEQSVLWDVLSHNEVSMTVIGLSVLPSPFPLEIGMSLVHTLLKSALIENADLSLETFKEKLYALNPFIKAPILIGQYHLNPGTFTFQTNGEFKVHHRTSEGQSILSPSQTALLDLGDVITLDGPSFGSSLSLVRIKDA